MVVFDHSSVRHKTTHIMNLLAPSNDKLVIARDFGAPANLLATSRFRPVPSLLREKDSGASYLHKGGAQRQMSLPS